MILAHQHDTIAHCEANPSESHIHGAEFLVNHCIVCCFQLSPSEQTAFSFKLKLPSFIEKNISPLVHSLLSGQTFSVKAPRGPPAFLA